MRSRRLLLARCTISTLPGVTARFSLACEVEAFRGEESDVSSKDDPRDGDLSKGDTVSWKSHGQKVSGTVEGQITKDTEAAGRTVRASNDDPQYRVRSDKTGREAVHKPSALTEED
jgi:Hypervirulence associated proteins TUDOR domain